MIRIPEFVKNVATLSLGSIAASAISLASVPIISRLFTPDDFGVASLFLSIVTVLAVVATLRYEHAVILPDEKDEATEVAFLSLVILAVWIVVVTVLTTSVYLLAPDFVWIKTLGMWCLLIPVGVCLISVSNVAVSLNTWLKNYRDIALAEGGQAGMMSISRITFGIVSGSTTAGLISGLLLAYATRVSILTRKLHFQESLRSANISKSRLGLLLTRYKQFPKFSMPTALLRSLGQNIPVFFLAVVFLPATVGFYAMANRLMRFPIALVGESVRRTYLQKAAELSNKKMSLAPSLIKTTVVLAATGIIIFSPLLFWGPQLFAIVLGDQWADGGKYVSILTPWFFSRFVQLASSVTYIVFQKQDQLFRIHTVSTLAIVIAFVLVYRFGASAELTLVALSGIGTITNILIFAQGIRLAYQYPQGSWQ